MSKSRSSSIFVSVLAVAFMAGALWAIFYVPGVFPWLNNSYLIIQNHLLKLYIIPNWIFYLLLLCVLYVAVSLIVLMVKPRQPKVTSYKQDYFLDIIWRWSYQRKMPVDPWCFCPDCKTELIYNYTGSRENQETELFCETCNVAKLRHDGDTTYLTNRVLRLIERKIRTGEWKEGMLNNIS